MNRYAKGANFEREIVASFWNHGWFALRSAGSGTTPHPSPDVVGVRNGRMIFVECKTTRKDRLSLKRNILELKEMVDICGCEAYLAIKFYKKPSRFYRLESVLESGNYTIKQTDPFMTFETVLNEQVTLQTPV